MIKPIWIGPRVGVMHDGVGVDQDLGPGLYIVAVDLTVGAACAAKEGPRSVQPKSLLHDGLQVGQIRDVRFVDQPRGPHHRVNLPTQLRQDCRVVEELHHGRLHRC